jgi:hypothetical protein
MPFDGVSFGSAELRTIDSVIDLISTPDKWCKGNIRTGDGRFCLRGAMREVDGADAMSPTILAAVYEVTGRHYRRIESFNDHPQTDHGQVIAVLLRAREHVATGRVIVTATRNTTTTYRGAIRSWFGIFSKADASAE